MCTNYQIPFILFVCYRVVGATESVAAPLEMTKTREDGGKLKVKSEPGQYARHLLIVVSLHIRCIVSALSFICITSELRTPNLDVSTTNSDFLSSLKVCCTHLPAIVVDWYKLLYT